MNKSFAAFSEKRFLIFRHDKKNLEDRFKKWNSLGLGCREGDDLADVLEAADEADHVEGGGREAARLIQVFLEAEDQFLQPKMRSQISFRRFKALEHSLTFNDPLGPSMIL